MSTQVRKSRRSRNVVVNFFCAGAAGQDFSEPACPVFNFIRWDGAKAWADPCQRGMASGADGTCRAMDRGEQPDGDTASQLQDSRDGQDGGAVHPKNGIQGCAEGTVKPMLPVVRNPCLKLREAEGSVVESGLGREAAGTACSGGEQRGVGQQTALGL